MGFDTVHHAAATPIGCLVCFKPVRPPAFAGDHDPGHIICRNQLARREAMHAVERARAAYDRAQRLAEEVLRRLREV